MNITAKDLYGNAIDCTTAHSMRRTPNCIRIDNYLMIGTSTISGKTWMYIFTREVIRPGYQLVCRFCLDCLPKEEIPKVYMVGGKGLHYKNVILSPERPDELSPLIGIRDADQYMQIKDDLWIGFNMNESNFNIFHNSRFGETSVIRFCDIDPEIAIQSSAGSYVTHTSRQPVLKQTAA